MKISEFDINRFIDDVVLTKAEEEHQYEERKASLYRQIKELFKKCSFGSGHVLGHFPLSRFDSDEVSKFIRYILTLRDQYGREIVSQMNKININAENDQWLNAYEASGEYADNMRNSDLFRSCVATCRDVIRKRPTDFIELFELNKVLFEHLLYESKNFHDIGRYLNLSENIVLQTVIYWIVSNDGVEETMKKKFIIELEQVIDDLDQGIDNAIQSMKKKSEINIDDAVIMFMLYLKGRNYFGEYVKVLKKLREEKLMHSELFAEVKSCYKVDKETVVDKNEIQILITEGSSEYDFDRKLKEAQEIIRVFKGYFGRVADEDNILDMKVYYREIFLSKSKHTRQAKSIIRKYLAQYKETGDIAAFSFDSESLFIREKINRGYFRECGGLAGYNEKNALQTKLFELYQKVHLLFSYEESLKFIYFINYHFLDRITELIFGHGEKK